MRRYRASWSGLWTIAMVAFLMAVASVAIPLAIHEKAWLEGAVACVACWVIAWVFVSIALFVQPDIEEDLPSPSVNMRGTGKALEGVFHSTGCIVDEGCLAVVAAILGAILLFIAFTLLFELLFPALIVMLFWPLQKGISRVIDRHPECADNLMLSVGWAFAWATVAVGPVAIIVCSALSFWKP